MRYATRNYCSRLLFSEVSCPGELALAVRISRGTLCGTLLKNLLDISVKGRDLQLLRTMLFVPANNPERFSKALNSGADAVIIDLEDAIPPDRKNEARCVVVEFLKERPSRDYYPSIFVRINGAGTPWVNDDLDAVSLPGLAGIFFPKAESPDDILVMAERILVLAKDREFAPPVLVPIVETARGILEAFPIVSAISTCAGLALGGEDFANSVGALRTSEGQELSLARMQVVLAARAVGAFPIDTVYTDYKDEAGLVHDAEWARQLGFAGKLVIHPCQVGPVNRVFSPSSQEVDEARAVLMAFESAQERGEAVASLAGKMLDPAVVEQARSIVRLADTILRVESVS